MPDTSIPLQHSATAEQVVAYIASRVVKPGWRIAFAHVNTSLPVSYDRDSDRSHDRVAWRMSWGGLVDEARDGDLDMLIDRITVHSEEIERRGRVVVPSDKVPNWLNCIRAEYPPESDLSLVVSSRVTSSGTPWLWFRGPAVSHIPMMDFRCEPSDRSLEFVVKAMRKLGQRKGIVLESGRSYHYYGFELLDEEEWRDFMHRSLLLTPFVDPRYIGHRLLAGTARLRITASRGKPAVPRVVADLSEGEGYARDLLERAPVPTSPRV